MNRTIAVIIAVVLVVSVVSVVYVVPAIAPKTSGMTIAAYDEAGNKVWEKSTLPGLIGFGFQNKDGPIYSVVVTVTHSVSGQDSGSAVSVVAIEKVICCSMYASDPSSALKTTNGPGWSDTSAINTHTTTYTVSELITRNSKGDEFGYVLYFYVTLSATALAEGVSSTRTLPLTGTMDNVFWVESTFSIVGSISLD